MRDDTSAIPIDSGCNVLNSSTQITHYSDNHNRDIYLLIGDKWIKQQHNYSNYGYDYSAYECVDVTQLPSQNIAFYPIYEFFVFLIACGFFGFVFWLVFKPLIWGANG